jgi:MtrB/PioB family decaheme-associated outer membrane protein
MTTMRTTNRLSIPAGALLTLLVSALWAAPASGQVATDPNAAPTTPAAPEAAMPAKKEAPAPAAGGQSFSFRLDPLVIGVLDTHVDTRSAKFEEYRDVSSGFVLPYFHLAGESADGNRTLDLNAHDVRRTDARYTLDYAVAGKYELYFDYNKIPHRFGNDGHMLWTRTGDGTLEIADPTQAQIQGAIAAQFAKNPAGINFSFLNGLLAPYLATARAIDLGLERDRSDARLNLGKMGPLVLSLEYTHENRRGTRPFGASFGFSNATEVPEPIDYNTDGAQLAGEWRGPRGGLQVGYRYSKFANNISTLTWDNPFRATDSTDPNAYTAPGAGSINGASRGFADLAASNRANMAFANGQAKLPGGWWVNGGAFYDQMKQNDPLLPYTLNTAIVGIAGNGAKFDPTNPANLPARSFDGKVGVTSLTGNAGNRFGAFDLTFHYRYYDYNDKSPRLEFPGYVRFQSVWENIARISVPYSYSRQNAGAELGWQVHPTTRLALALDNESWNREFREVKKTDENVWKLSADTRPNQRFTLRGSYEHGDRTIGAYNPNAQGASFVEPEALTNLPDLRKFDEAARTYNSWKLQAQVFATDEINLSLGTTGRKDDYTKSLFGLKSDDVKAYNAEISYTPGADRDFFLFGERMDRRSLQNARQSGATPSTNPLDNWAADLKEITDTWGLGWTEKFAKVWTLDLTGNLSRSDGQARFPRPLGANPPGVGFDNYEDIKLLALLGKLDYAVTPATTVGLFYRYEKYTIDSFILQGLRNYLPGALLLNANNGNYKGSIYGLTMKHVF